MLLKHIPIASPFKTEELIRKEIEGEYFEQEIPEVKFIFESDNKVLESLDIFLDINDKKQIQSNRTINIITSKILTTNKTRQFFLEDNESIDMDDIVIVKHFPIPTNVKGARC